MVTIIIIIILCIIAYFVIGAFLVSRFVEDFFGFPIDFEFSPMTGGFASVWPIFLLLYGCQKLVAFFKTKQNGRTDSQA